MVPHVLDLALEPDEVLQAQLGGKVLWHLALPKNLMHEPLEVLAAHIFLRINRHPLFLHLVKLPEVVIKNAGEFTDPQLGRHLPVLHRDLILAEEESLDVFTELSMPLFRLNDRRLEEILDDLNPCK